MPALIVVPPLKVLVPVSVRVPAPDLDSDPAPVMAPERVWLADEAYSKTEPVAAMESVPVPAVPAPPMMRLPALIVVAPE